MEGANTRCVCMFCTLRGLRHEAASGLAADNHTPLPRMQKFQLQYISDKHLRKSAATPFPLHTRIWARWVKVARRTLS